jgi:methionyl-tRNA synthetase
VREGNRYVDQTQPWVLARDPANAPELAHVFHNLANVIGVIGGLVMPVLPTAGKMLRDWVGMTGHDAAKWPEVGDMHRVVGAVAKDVKPLFPRLDDAMQKKILDAVVPPDVGAAAKVETSTSTSTSTSTIQKSDVDRVEIRVGKIVEAAAIPKKDKVLRLTVDFGEDKPRTVVSGIALKHKPETLVGKSALFVTNLAPAKLAGIVSEAMILAAGEDAILTTVASDVPPGTRVQ